MWPGFIKKLFQHIDGILIPYVDFRKKEIAHHKKWKIGI
jgi:hypothetical protein